VLIFKRQFLFARIDEVNWPFLINYLMGIWCVNVYVTDIVFIYETLLIETARHIKCGQNVFRCPIFSRATDQPRLLSEYLCCRKSSLAH